MTVQQQIRQYNRQFALTTPAELAIKIGKMEADVFQFYRATAHLFYRDMAMLPASDYATPQTARTWLLGDAHLVNFCAMRDAGGAEVFAASDFDEGDLGQYVWDLRRLAASLLLAKYGAMIPPAGRSAAIAAMARAYLERMAAFSGTDDELGFRLTEENTSGTVQATLAKAARDKRSDLLRKFMDEKRTAAVGKGTRAAVEAAMPDYIASVAPSRRMTANFYTVLDVRRRIGAGTGSLGKLRYHVLLQGPTGSPRDNVVLELKQAVPGSISLAGGERLSAAAYGGHHGRRIALTQQAMLPGADVMAGYTTIDGLPFHAREKAPTDRDFDPEDIASAQDLQAAAASLGMALASAHALAGHADDGRLAAQDIDRHITAAVTSRSGFIDELTSFAERYAEQVRQDWHAFQEALARGEAMF